MISALGQVIRACCCVDAEGDLEEALTKSQKTVDGEFPKVIVEKITGILKVVLPSKKTLLPGRNEGNADREIVAIMVVMLRRLTRYSDEDCVKLLLKACPARYANFSTTVTTYGTDTVRHDPDTVRLIELWFEVDRDNSGNVTKLEAQQLLHQLNINMTDYAFKKLFNSLDKDGSESLESPEFLELFVTLTELPETELHLMLEIPELHAGLHSIKCKRSFYGFTFS